MILIDASVLVSIYLEEPGFEKLKEVLQQERVLIAAPTLFEYGAKVFAKTGLPERMRGTVAAVRAQAHEIIPIDETLMLLANDAMVTYGKLAGHPANLNFGDCLVYAASKGRGLPLLFKGDDFVHTDLVLHPASQCGNGEAIR